MERLFSQKLKQAGLYFVGVVLMVLCLFSPEFRFPIKYTWLLAGMGLVLVLWDAWKYRRIDRQGMILYGLCGLAAVWGLGMVLLNRTGDYSYLVFQIGTLLSIFRNYLVIGLADRCCAGEESRVQKYMNMYVDACVVAVVFTLAFMAMPAFKTFWLESVIYTGQSDYAAYEYRYSVGGFAAFSYSSTLSIALLLNAYLLGKNVDNNKCFRYLVTYVLLIVGSFFYGRVTLVAIAVSVLLGAFITKLSKRTWTRVVAPLVITIAILVAAVYAGAEVSPSIRTWRDWAFAIVIQLFSGNGITDFSFVNMFENMYFGVDSVTFLFGKGCYNVASEYGFTDVGFLRAILYFGIFGCLMNYTQALTFFAGITKNCKKNRAMIALLVSLLIVFVVLEMKGDAYHRILLAVMPIYYLLMMEKKEKLSP